ncbi:hypothetical protein ACFL6C_09420 [Myxococcota bacterium]
MKLNEVTTGSFLEVARNDDKLIARGWKPSRLKQEPSDLVELPTHRTTGSNSAMAPPPFDILGGRAVFVDIQNVDVAFALDCKKRIATARAVVDFEQPEEGFPVIDLVPDVTELVVDGESVSPRLFLTCADPDRASQLRLVGKALRPGSHRVEIEYNLPQGIALSFKDRGVAFEPRMSDLNARQYLEQIVPSNYLHDQFRLKMRVSIQGSQRDHDVVANGRVTKIDPDGNDFEVEFPEFFNSACFFFRIFDPDSVAKECANFAGRVPITVIAGSETAAREVLGQIEECLSEYERDFGPFPHPQLLCSVHGWGMEYAGAVQATPTNVVHEVGHQYHGRGFLPANGDAGWIDEAIVTWLLAGSPRATAIEWEGDFPALAGRSPYRRDTPWGNGTWGSYEYGAHVLSELDFLLEQHGGLKPLLRGFFETYRGRPVTTEMFQQFLEDRAGLSLAQYFDAKVFRGRPEHAEERRFNVVLKHRTFSVSRNELFEHVLSRVIAVSDIPEELLSDPQFLKELLNERPESLTQLPDLPPRAQLLELVAQNGGLFPHLPPDLQIGQDFIEAALEDRPDMIEHLDYQQQQQYAAQFLRVDGGIYRHLNERFRAPNPANKELLLSALPGCARWLFRHIDQDLWRDEEVRVAAIVDCPDLLAEVPGPQRDVALMEKVFAQNPLGLDACPADREVFFDSHPDSAREHRRYKDALQKLNITRTERLRPRAVIDECILNRTSPRSPNDHRPTALLIYARGDRFNAFEDRAFEKLMKHYRVQLYEAADEGDIKAAAQAVTETGGAEITYIAGHSRPGFMRMAEVPEPHHMTPENEYGFLDPSDGDVLCALSRATRPGGHIVLAGCSVGQGRDRRANMVNEMAGWAPHVHVHGPTHPDSMDIVVDDSGRFIRPRFRHGRAGTYSIPPRSSLAARR